MLARAHLPRDVSDIVKVGTVRAMTETEAEQRAKVLNKQLGVAGNDRDYYMPFQTDDGGWDVEKRRDKLNLFDRIMGALPP